VDEAARANPLDLLIPMSIAKRRIILVGDQRQLPHLLEPEVERSLMREGTLQEHQQKALKESLFGRLFARMKELEKVDGIKRTVTLDTQYRMHPELAKFVSQQFYAPYKEEFQSVRSAEGFAHRVPGFEGKFAAWYDVPIGEGAEKSGQSKSRPNEARQVASLTKDILVQCPELSVGVITFYSEQVRTLWTEFSKFGLSERQTEENQRSAWQIKEQYRFTEAEVGEQQERLRLGTVDAFQGKEFDVVILSLTRSNKISVEVENPNSQRLKWGHLSLENRLNVAMSRQKRLLIVVGDREMVLHPVAQEAVPALVAFERLCRGLYE
jgi:superfamily I DNA and/or RNA helicase